MRDDLKFQMDAPATPSPPITVTVPPNGWRTYPCNACGAGAGDYSADKMPPWPYCKRCYEKVIDLQTAMLGYNMDLENLMNVLREHANKQGS